MPEDLQKLRLRLERVETEIASLHFRLSRSLTGDLKFIEFAEPRITHVIEKGGADFRIKEGVEFNVTGLNVHGLKFWDAVVDINGNGDYTTIQSALTAGAKRILIMPGTYTEAIDFPNTANAFFHLEGLAAGQFGSSNSITKINYAGSDHTLYMPGNPAGLTLKNLWIENANTSSYSAIKFAGSVTFNIEVQNCIIKGGEYGVWGWSAYSGIVNNYFADQGVYALELAGDGRVIICHNIIQLSASGKGVSTAGTGLVITGNVIRKTTTGTSTYGIYHSADNSVIIGNTIYGLATITNGIYLGATANYNVISENSFGTNVTNHITDTGSDNLILAWSDDHSKLEINYDIDVPEVWSDGLASALVEKDANYTATSSDSTILGNAIGGTFAITLPTASGITGRVYTVKKIDSSGNTVSVATAGTEKIDQASAISLAVQWYYVTVQSDGTDWKIISRWDF